MDAIPTDSDWPPFYLGGEVRHPTAVFDWDVVHLVFPGGHAGVAEVESITCWPADFCFSHLIIEIDASSRRPLAVHWVSEHIRTRCFTRRLQVVVGSNHFRSEVQNDLGNSFDTECFASHVLDALDIENLGVRSGTIMIQGLRDVRVWESHGIEHGSGSVSLVHAVDGIRCHIWKH